MLKGRSSRLCHELCAWQLPSTIIRHYPGDSLDLQHCRTAHNGPSYIGDVGSLWLQISLLRWRLVRMLLGMQSNNWDTSTDLAHKVEFLLTANIAALSASLQSLDAGMSDEMSSVCWWADCVRCGVPTYMLFLANIRRTRRAAGYQTCCSADPSAPVLVSLPAQVGAGWRFELAHGWNCAGIFHWHQLCNYEFSLRSGPAIGACVGRTGISCEIVSGMSADCCTD
jgi:hypothetical protein